MNGNFRIPLEKLIMSQLGNNVNPMLMNLIKMAQNNDTNGLETFARNVLKEQGRDFDKEMGDFINTLK